MQTQPQDSGAGTGAGRPVGPPLGHTPPSQKRRTLNLKGLVGPIPLVA